MAAAVVFVSIAFVRWSGMRPGYDAYGWLVWGRQTLHGNLNTDGAPSWKPLTFLFTLPYSLTGGTAVWLWMVTAVTAGLSGCVFAARIAYRLTRPAAASRWAPIAAAAFAGTAELGVNGYGHLMLIANSDPMIISLCLAAIDAHLSRRPRLAFALLALAALGRPEVWVFVGLYALWAGWTQRSMRVLAAAGLTLIPTLWLAVPALTSKSWLTPGDLALNSVNVIHGSKITGVIHRMLTLNEPLINVAAGLALVIGIIRRDRATLAIGAAALLWAAVEIAFALHGWSAASRYLAEPAALVVVLAGVAVGQLLTITPSAPRIVRWAGALAVLATIVLLLPAARTRERSLVRATANQRVDTTRIKRLQAVIAREGGPSRILACGQPVSLVGYQSTLAYYVGLNVGNVGYNPGHAINSGKPIVLFKPHIRGWEVRPSHALPANSASCAELRTDTAF